MKRLIFLAFFSITALLVYIQTASATCTSNSQCNDSNACTNDICSISSGTCTNKAVAAGTICRAAASGGCDIAEKCNGTSAPCPADSFLPSTYTCRAAVGGCDAPETCTGTTALCPANTLLPAGAVCRAAAGVCDITETCTGTSGLCPADSMRPAGYVCRASAGTCDTAESCSGSSVSCPADGVCGWDRRVSMALVVDGLKPASIAVDSAGNSYVIGTTGLGADPDEPLVSLGYRVWVVKYDVCGNEVWSRTYLPNNGQGTGIAIGPSGFIYAAAQAYSLGLTGHDIYIGKLAPVTGDVAWWTVFDGPGTVPPGGRSSDDFDRPDDITVDSHGNIFVTGVITREITTTAKEDLWVGKFRENAAGTGADLLAQTTYNGPADADDEGKALLLDSTELNLYVTGYTGASSAPYNHLFLQKYSAVDLSPLWASPVEGSITGGVQGVVGESVKLNGGKLYVGGIAGAADLTGWRPLSDGFIGFFDSTTGAETNTPLYLDGVANQRDGVMDILVDSSVLYLTGARTDVPVTNDVYSGDMWTAKVKLETRATTWSDMIAGNQSRADFGSRLARDSAGYLYVVGELEVEAPITSPPCIHSYCFHQFVIHQYCPAEMGP